MANSSKRLNGYVTFTPEDGGASVTFGPDDELPDWAAKQATADHLKASDDDADDLLVPGPGQLPGDGLTEDEKAEARKEADRKRKADKRAADKKAAEDQAALDAATEAEATRKAEADAEAQRAADAAGQGGA